VKQSYPWLALGLGLLLALVVLRFGILAPEGEQSLPLLTLLLMSEFGFVATAIAAAMSVRDISRQGARLPSIALLAWMGIKLWPGSFDF
jgi:hypothetical protein